MRLKFGNVVALGVAVIPAVSCIYFKGSLNIIVDYEHECIIFVPKQKQTTQHHHLSNRDHQNATPCKSRCLILHAYVHSDGGFSKHVIATGGSWHGEPDQGATRCRRGRRHHRAFPVWDRTHGSEFAAVVATTGNVIGAGAVTFANADDACLDAAFVQHLFADRIYKGWRVTIQRRGICMDATAHFVKGPSRQGAHLGERPAMVALFGRAGGQTGRRIEVARVVCGHRLRVCIRCGLRAVRSVECLWPCGVKRGQDPTDKRGGSSRCNRNVAARSSQPTTLGMHKHIGRTDATPTAKRRTSANMPLSRKHEKVPRVGKQSVLGGSTGD